MTPRPLHIIQTTGAANYLSDPTGDRRFFALPVRALEFTIKPPGCKPYKGLFATAQQAREHAERTHPDTFPASVVCTSRLRTRGKP